MAQETKTVKPLSSRRRTKNQEPKEEPKQENQSVENLETAQQEAPQIVNINLDEPQKPKETKTPNKSKNAEPSKIDDVSQGIGASLKFLFDVVSLRAGKHWAISDAEANSISNPLCKILDKYNILDKVEKISDAGALIAATSMVIVPRVIISQQLKQKERIQDNEQKREDNTTSKQDTSKSEPSNVSTDGKTNDTLMGVEYLGY